MSLSLGTFFKSQTVPLIDSNTKEIVNFEVAKNYYDGSPMNDSRIDGIVYGKKNGVYYKRAGFNGYVDISWFGAKGDGITNDNASFLSADKYKLVYLSDPNKVYKVNTELKAKYFGRGTILNNGLKTVLTDVAQYVYNSTKFDLKFIGTGLNDLQINGEFSLSAPASMIVTIDKVNQNINGVITDTFKYSFDGGLTWVINNLTIDPTDDSETLLPLLCSDRNWTVGYSGVKIDFGNKTGHTVGDKWTVELKPQSSSFDLSGIIKYNNSNFIRVQDSGGLVIGKNSGDGGKNIGAGSIIIGSDSYKNSVTGYSNVGIGNYVLSNNTSGALNIAIGDYTLNKNTTGQDNVAVGVYTMFDNTTGYGNAGLGQDALRYNKTGNYNTALGAQSLYFNNSTGNTGVGNSAVRANVNGYANTGLGKYSMLINQNGSMNTSIGSDSFYNLNGGNNNVSLGESSGFRLTTGNENVFLGAKSGSNEALQKKDAVNSIAIGYGSYTDKNNQISLGNESISEVIFRGSVKVGNETIPINTLFIKYLKFIGNNHVFESNTEAKNNGMTSGEVYRTSDGTLKVVY